MARAATDRIVRGRSMLALVAFALLAPGCKTWQSFKERTNSIRTALTESGYDDPRAQEKLERADELFNQQNYPKAQEVYRDITDNRNNPADLAEIARYMQAECRYARGQYPEAVDTYHKLLMDFPVGAHRRDACARMYEIADYWLNDFRNELDRRKDEKGILGWRPEWRNPLDKTRLVLGQEGRALEAMEHIWTHDMYGPFADKCLFWCGYVNYIRGNFQEADHFFSTLVQMHKESPLRPQAMAYAIQAKNNATGGADYDSRKCAEALELVHQAERTVPELTQDPKMAEKMTRARFAIRSQQAEKDMKMAEYYARTGHPGSAVFYYELVRRRYAGTRYSDIATERKDWLVSEMKKGNPLPGIDPLAQAKVKFKELFGKKETAGNQGQHAEENAGGAIYDPRGPAGLTPAGGPSSWASGPGAVGSGMNIPPGQ
ncbi:MAG TPA: tetratricopeptide repeat protein [Gemmata sp.]|nr:tetratricopeptide repeat protein [Gemmata sp.]